MKKVICTILVVLFSITGVMFAFSWLNISKKTASAETFNENALSGKVNIVDPTNLLSSLYVDAVQNKSLFDYETKQARPGYAIFPNPINNAKEINSTYGVEPFSLTRTDSIYIWVFIPNQYCFDLTFKFYSGQGETISWLFEMETLKTMLESHSVENSTYGWRLFELNVSDSLMEDSVKESLNSIEFKNFNISYIMSDDMIFVESNKNNFAFYHVYKAQSYSNRSKIVHGQNYVIYDLKNGYFRDDAYFIDEEILFSGIKNLFDFLIVGQVDLVNETNSNYSWKITLTDSQSNVSDIAFGEKYIFEHYGYHKIEMMLSEYRGANIETVLYLPFSIYVDLFALGAFTNVGYEVDVGETKLIYFDVSSYFEQTGDIKVYVSDKNKASTTYYVKDGFLNIELTGLKKGDIKIFVEATGKRIGTEEISTFTCSTAAKIKYVGKSSSEIFLWVILCIYGVGFVIFIAISLVKARKFSVK